MAEEEEHFSQEVIQNEIYENFHERIEEEYAFCLSQAVTLGEMEREVYIINIFFSLVFISISA